ncbi:2-C-methyl-D-erythritol 4-phosphate cytidylyltransferase [Compostibacter hankyongensis]|uniref:2-C-methyl-D-erythritol 4-phosphate cytidylyltransferase n=1 Tax=Compostibacter hankyongensis TaxID=1007089 RepID=A0ABP8FII2_9BACT
MSARKRIAVIVAGGNGTRMGSALPKQFLPLCGRPVLYHTLRTFLDAYGDMTIVLVLPAEHREHADDVLKMLDHTPRIRQVAGGDTRFQSVKNGLGEIKDPAVVFVHDGVRPLLSVALIHRCYDQALTGGSAIPVVPVRDSIRRKEDGRSEAVDRDKFCLVQTPQTFLSEILLPAFAQPYQPHFTDEATVVEAAGHTLCLVSGEERNIKITHPTDLLIAERLLATPNP